MNLRTKWPLVASVGMLMVALSPGWGAEPTAPAGKPQAEPADKRIVELIKQLGDKDYRIRQSAQDELAKLEFEAFDALQAAVNDEDFEIASRAKYLLRLMQLHLTNNADPPQVRKLLERYEIQNLDVRRRLIHELASMFSDATLPALCRVIRFERSAILSKYAALEVINEGPYDPPSKLLREHLEGSHRSSARWLLAYLRAKDAPGQPLDELTALIESEAALLARSGTEQTSAAVVIPTLYLLADLHALRGNKAQAEQIAQRARQIAIKSNDKNNESDLKIALQTAGLLRRRGHFDWAEQECRRLSEVPNLDISAAARITLAEAWHDRGDDVKAAETMQQFLHWVEAKENRGDVASDRIDQLRARMYYFQACDAQQHGNRAKQIENLDKAVRVHSTEIDSLIALYRLPDQPPERRRNIERMVAAAMTDLRQKLSQREGQDSENFNLFAWLVGNTEGDLNEALGYGRRAVELHPNNGAYLDTLAHVYFAKKDYASAVKHQTQAAQQEPFSGLITKELKAFQEAAKTQAKHAPSVPANSLLPKK